MQATLLTEWQCNFFYSTRVAALVGALRSNLSKLYQGTCYSLL